MRGRGRVTLAICTCALFGASTPALAQDFWSGDADFNPPDATFFSDTDFSYAAPSQNVTLRGSIGFSSITANEHVYAFSTGSENLSLLQWESRAPIASLGAKLRFPGGWTLRGHIDGAIGGDSVITDYDWTSYSPSYDFEDWDHRSISPDTRLDWYLKGDVAFGRDLPINQTLTVNLNAGLSYTDVHWTARGGHYIYSTSGFRDDEGDLPSGPVGDYRQQFPTIFAGAEGSIIDGAVSFQAGARAGLIFAGQSTDNHYLRDLRIVDQLRWGQILEANATLGFNVSDHLGLFVQGAYEKMFTPHVPTDYIDTTTGKTTIHDSIIGGAELDTIRLQAGLKGSF